MLDERVFAAGDQGSTMWGRFDRWLCGDGCRQVVSFLGDDVPDATAWIFDVSKTAWNDVHMKMRNRLASGGAFVEPNVKPIDSIPITQQRLRSADHL
jgi:hypothetical protein